MTEAPSLLFGEDRAEAGYGVEIATPVDRKDCSCGEGTGIAREERRCYDAVAESFFATLKRELAWIHHTKT